MTLLPRRLLVGLLLAVGAVTVVGVGAQVADEVLKGGESGALSRLELDEERSLPTLFSSGVLATAALLLGLTAWVRRRVGGSDALSWWLLCIVVSAFALDEQLAMHETLIAPLRGALGADGVLHYTWLLPVSIVVAGLVVVFAGFARRLDASVQRPFAAAIALFFAGALGVEALGGLYVSTRGSEEGLAYALITSFEETLEMLGSVILVYALTVNLAIHRPPVRVGVGRPSHADSGARVEVTTEPSRVRVVLVGLALLLVAGSVVSQLADVLYLHGRLDAATGRLDVATERSVPTFLSALLFLATGAIAATMGLFSRRQRQPYWAHWLALGVVLAALAADESLEGHEVLTGPVRELLGLGGGVLEYAWVIPGLLGVIVLGLVYARFLLQLPRRTLRLLACAAALFLAGALGVELIGGWWASANGKANVVYVLLTSLEELLELCGLAVLAYGLLSHIGEHMSDLTVQAVPHSAHELTTAEGEPAMSDYRPDAAPS